MHIGCFQPMMNALATAIGSKERSASRHQCASSIALQLAAFFTYQFRTSLLETISSPKEANRGACHNEEARHTRIQLNKSSDQFQASTLLKHSWRC